MDLFFVFVIVWISVWENVWDKDKDLESFVVFNVIGDFFKMNLEFLEIVGE